MKIAFNCSNPLLSGLRRKLFEEGNEITSVEEADLTLTDNLTDKAKLKIGIGIVVPDLVLNSLGYETSNEVMEPSEKLCVTRWFDGEAYARQTLLSISVIGQFNDNLGTPLCGGTAARYINSIRYVQFEDEGVIEFLQASEHRGFVSFELVEGKVSKLHLGIPYLGMYNAVQGMWNRELTPWLLEPSRLLESWTVSLLVATGSCEEGTKVPFESISHTQPFYLTESQRTDFFVPHRAQIAVTTGWSHRLQEAGRFALESARLLNVKNKLYRTDVATQVERKVEDLRRVAPQT